MHERLTRLDRLEKKGLLKTNDVTARTGSAGCAGVRTGDRFLRERLDNDRYALKVTPRQPTSKWSDINRKRWAELKAAGLLTSAGLAAAPADNSYAPRPVIPDLPVYIAKALKANLKAWEFFGELAPTWA